MENKKSGGMSKGCVVALIVGGIAILLVAITAGACWVYKDDLVKMAGNTALSAMKTQMAENTLEGVDTTQFNTLVDAFTERVDATDSLDLRGYGELMTRLGEIIKDEEVSLADVVEISDAMVGMYPELEELRITIPEVEEMPTDSTTTDTTLREVGTE